MPGHTFALTNGRFWWDGASIPKEGVMMGRALVWIVLLSAGAQGATDVAARCCADRLRVAGSREKQLLACHARAAARGLAVDPACVAKVGDALTRTFARIEDSDGCPGSGNGARVDADLDRMVAAIAAALRPTSGASACTARKLKATGRFASTTARLFALQAPYPPGHLDVLDPFTLAYGQQFLATIAALETRPDCLTTGDGTRLVQLVTIGTYTPSPFVPPDGMLMTSMRVCPACGDLVQGGAEQCDGAFDAPDCNGPCRADCTCPVCGDGVKNQTTETCDGTDAAACPGLCQGDCTCPTPVCGNGVKEAGEDCDGAALGACGSGCQPDCTCPPAMCGNGIVEQAEQCDGTTTCTLEGVSGFGCSTSCQCCDGGYCPIVGCCDPHDVCMPFLGPFGTTYGNCAPAVTCTTDANCSSGYTCLPNQNPPPATNLCHGVVGGPCPTVYFPQYNLSYTYPCAPPAVCTSAVCCLPAGTACGADGECCNGSCTGGTCN
jgi:hypothetical protein